MKRILKLVYEYLEHKVQILRGKYILKCKDFTIISNNCWGGEFISVMRYLIPLQQLG